jgi:hypothetical protein
MSPDSREGTFMYLIVASIPSAECSLTITCSQLELDMHGVMYDTPMFSIRAAEA